MLPGSRQTLPSASAARQGSRRPQADDLVLPAYQAPRLPLAAGQQQQLRALAASGRLHASLRRHAEASATLLARAVYTVHERVTRRREAAAARAAKRQRRDHHHHHHHHDADGAAGDGGGAEAVEDAKTEVAALQAVVDPLTLEVEEAMRAVLDMQAALQDEQDLLKELPAMVAVAQRDKAGQARPNAPGGEDEDPPEVSGVSLHRLVEQARTEKAKAYEDLSMFQKYAKNNAYIEFRRNWHDGLHPGDEIPVPDPKTWFDKEGRPQHVTGAEGGDEDDSEAEVQVMKAKRSFRCPLSLVVLSEPYTCHRCKHSFQKDAIYAYLKIKGPDSAGEAMKCPETGCYLQDMRKDDLFYDEPLLRKIKRAQQQEEQQERERASSSDREDDTVEGTVKPEAEEDDDDVADEVEEDDD